MAFVAVSLHGPSVGFCVLQALKLSFVVILLYINRLLIQVSRIISLLFALIYMYRSSAVLIVHNSLRYRLTCVVVFTLLWSISELLLYISSGYFLVYCCLWQFYYPNVVVLSYILTTMVVTYFIDYCGDFALDYNRRWDYRLSCCGFTILLWRHFCLDYCGESVLQTFRNSPSADQNKRIWYSLVQ